MQTITSFLGDYVFAGVLCIGFFAYVRVDTMHVDVRTVA